MKKKLLLLSLSVALALPSMVIAQGQNVRTWKSANGSEAIMQFIRMDGDHCIMKTKDGAERKFAISLLAEEDQKIARSMRPLKTNTGSGRTSTDSAVMIDKIIYDNLVVTKTRPNEQSDDPEFVRRVYLDTVGRIPNLQETRDFLADTDPNKRNTLIDSLLDTDGYKANLFNYFADMLRLRKTLGGNNYVRGVSYIQWVKDCIQENRPYNQMVYEMLTAEGKVWDNPASGYMLRDSGMPLDSMANTVSIFLGTEIACAQCHDHPFYDDTWTQAKFYEMAGFFGSTVTRLGLNDFKNGDPLERINSEVVQLIKSQGGDPKDDKAGRSLNQLGNMIGANRFVVKDIEENRIRLPHDYKYSDHKPGDVLDPKFIQWPEEEKFTPKKQAGMNDRQRFAHWLSHKENPMFAKVIANRLWGRAFGIAVIEPVDNLFSPAMDANPKLAAFLADEMRRVDFDLKEFQRAIFYSKAYQAKATTAEHELGTNYAFQGPLLRRMSAEQIWDSYMTLVLGNPDQFRGDSGELYERTISMDLDKTTGMTAISKLTAYQQLGNKQRAMNKGGKMMAGGDDGEESMGMAMGMNYQSRGGMELLRASELEQPARADHFLAEFGQSTRDIFDSSSKEGSVPQILRMMNGGATKMLTESSSLIYKNMDKEKTDDAKVEAVFLSILNRPPSLQDKDIAARGLKGGGREAYQDLIWSLINTREFMFIQ